MKPWTSNPTQWETFSLTLHAALEAAGQRTLSGLKKSPAGRKPLDEILTFKVLVLQSLHNLGDDNVEYQIRDRVSFMRFLGLGLHDRAPDARTVWLYREILAKSDVLKDPFDDFDRHSEHNS